MLFLLIHSVLSQPPRYHHTILCTFGRRSPYVYYHWTLRTLLGTDDLVFFIYIYQRWHYAVDYSRPTIGHDGEEEEEEDDDGSKPPAKRPRIEKDPKEEDRKGDAEASSSSSSGEANAQAHVAVVQSQSQAQSQVQAQAQAQSQAQAQAQAQSQAPPQPNGPVLETEQQRAARLAEKRQKCADWAVLLAKDLPRPKSLRQALVEFYSVHNPTKLPDIDKVTAHYNVYGDPNLWHATNLNEMHTVNYKSGTADMRLDRMFADINTHYGVPAADGTISGARPRKPDTRTLVERLSDATLTSHKAGGGKTPVALKKGAPVWAHILSFHNFCEYPTHIFGGGAHRIRDFGKIVHPELELRLLCRGMYRALVSQRDAFYVLVFKKDFRSCTHP
jgi:hypothetical protein